MVGLFARAARPLEIEALLACAARPFCFRRLVVVVVVAARPTLCSGHGRGHGHGGIHMGMGMGMGMGIYMWVLGMEIGMVMDGRATGDAHIVCGAG